MGGRHTTVIDAARPIVDFAQKIPDVTKVVAGYITPGIKSGQQRIKIKEMTGGLLVVVRGGASIQEIMIYSSNISKTREAIERDLL